MRACNAKSHKWQWYEANIISIEIFAPFVCSCSCQDSRVPPLNLYYDTSVAEDLHCWKAVDRNFVRNGGTTRTHSSPCSWAGVSEQIANDDFVFQKYKQDSAFRVSGVLQLAKTGPSVTKSFPLRRLFPSDAIMAWRFYTPYDVKCTNLHILTAHGMSHILTRSGQLWSSRKNLYALARSPNSKITNQRIINFNNLG